jgi:hypothetical protein
VTSGRDADINATKSRILLMPRIVAYVVKRAIFFPHSHRAPQPPVTEAQSARWIVTSGRDANINATKSRILLAPTHPSPAFCSHSSFGAFKANFLLLLEG